MSLQVEERTLFPGVPAVRVGGCSFLVVLFLVCEVLSVGEVFYTRCVCVSLHECVCVDRLFVLVSHVF